MRCLMNEVVSAKSLTPNITCLPSVTYYFNGKPKGYLDDIIHKAISYSSLDSTGFIPIINSIFEIDFSFRNKNRRT